MAGAETLGAVLGTAVVVALAVGVLWRRHQAELTRSRDAVEQTAAHLAREVAFLQAALDQLPAGVILTHADGTVAFRNQACAASLPVGDFTGASITALTGLDVRRPDGTPAAFDEWPPVQTLRDGQPHRDPHFVLHLPGGGDVLYDCAAAPLRTADDVPAGVVTVFQDRVEQLRTEQRLRASDEQLAVALRAVRMVVWQQNVRTREVRRSSPLEEWVGVPRDLALDREGAFHHYIHPDDRDRVLAANERLKSGEIAEYDIDYRLRTAAGGCLRCSARARREVGPDGRPTDWITGVLIDSTERARSEARLRLVESAVVHARDAVIILDSAPTADAGRSVRYVNEAFTRMTGYSAIEVVGRSLSFLRGPNTDSATLDRMKAALAAGTSLQVELLNYRKDGSELWVELSLVPVPDDAGRCSHWVMIQRDVNDRKAAEVRLQRSESLFRGMFENAAAGVSLIDAHGRFTAVNPAFAALLGRPPEAIIGRSPREFTHPDDWRDQQPILTEIAAGTRSGYQVRERYLRPDGEVVWSELSVAVIRDPDGSVRNCLGVSVDMTGPRRLEEQLRHAQKMETVGQMAGGIAHDFNNLLTGVIGNLALVTLPDGDPNRDLIQTAEKAVHRAADLTRKLLGFARKSQLVAAPVVVGEFAREVADLVRRTCHSRVSIDLDVDLAAPVLADAGLLHQALMNLCLNARDSMPDGGTITIRAETVVVAPSDTTNHPHARAGEYIRLSVTDTGTGMAPAVKARLFEPFFTTKPIGQGTGLGLPMVHGIVRQHNGWVDVHTEVGRGTRFELYLPRYRESASAPLPVRSDVIGRGLTQRTAPPLADVSTPPPVGEALGGTVLLVDDEDLIRNLGKAVLEAAGFTVLEATDGVDAVEVFTRERAVIDLVVLDLTMPRLSGRDAFRAIASVDPAARVLFSSGYSTDDPSDLGGAIGMLAKPYRPQELVNAVRRALAADPLGIG